MHHSWCRLLLHRPLVPRPLPLSAETKFCSQVTSQAKPKQATSTPDPSRMMSQTIFCKPLNQCRLVLPQPLVPCSLKSGVQLSYPQLKMGSKQRLEMDEDSSMEWKMWQAYSFGKRKVFRFHLTHHCCRLLLPWPLVLHPLPRSAKNNVCSCLISQ